MSKVKLDKKDRAIVKALEEDGRALIKEISKKTGIPRDSVNYRIKKMISEGVIKGFVPVSDTNKLGYPVYTWAFFQLQHFDEETEKNFTNFLKSIPNIPYICRITGDFNYGLTIATKTIQELDKVIMKIINKFPNVIKNYKTYILLEETQYDTFYRLYPE